MNTASIQFNNINEARAFYWMRRMGFSVAVSRQLAVTRGEFVQKVRGHVVGVQMQGVV